MDIVKDNNCACDIIGQYGLGGELSTCKRHGKCMFCGTCGKSRNNHTPSCKYNASNDPLKVWAVGAGGGGGGGSGDKHVRVPPGAASGGGGGTPVYAPTRTGWVEVGRVPEVPGQKEPEAGARNVKGYNWFKPEVDRIDDLRPVSKPKRRALTSDEIVEKLWRLTPALSALQLLCPYCFKLMRPNITFSSNKDLTLFSLHCCFGAYTLGEVAGRDLADKSDEQIAEQLATSTEKALINLRSR